jgi:hypothetical protein
MALLDYYAATSIYGCIPSAQDYRGFFELRAKHFAVLTGVGGSRDMLKELQTVLDDYLNRFPFKLAQVRRARKSGSSFATSEVVDLTLTHRGGTERWVRHWAGRRSEIYAISHWRESFFNGVWNRRFRRRS